MKPISFPKAAFAGLLYAILMCSWVYFDRGLNFDQLAIRFAAYFGIFAVGFYLLYNFMAKRTGKSDDG